MKWTFRNWLLCAATVLAAAAAVILPPWLSALADGRLSQASYAVQVENMDISLVYQLSTAERLALMSRMDGEDTLTLSDMQPAQGELTPEQALAVCQEELDTLYRLGGLPAPFTAQTFQVFSYQVICDRDNPQRSLSLWSLILRSDDPSFFRADVILDAETGLIYEIYLPYHADLAYTISPPDILSGWGEYLSLGEPDLTGVPEVFPHILTSTTDSRYVEVSSPVDASIPFHTDEGPTASLYLRLSFQAYGAQETFQSLVISPRSYPYPNTDFVYAG